MRLRHLGLAALLVALFGAGFLAGKSPATSDGPYRDLDTFVEVLDKVQHNYVEPVSPNKLIKGAIDGMMKRLDPFSEYLDEAEYADLRSVTEGQFGGLGIVISIRNDFPTVISPVEGTPAYSLGIQSGDVIVKIDGASTHGFTAEDAVKKLRGAEGTPVTITIARDGEPNRDYKITRQVIHVKSVPYAFQVAPGVGYLRVSAFSETTGDEVRQAVARLTAGGARSLVVDLRDNPGGLLSQAVDMVETFVPRGSLVVFTKGRAPGSNEKVYATANRVPDSHPVVVLVNGGSASAAEIVAGAVQDLDRGLVVGTTSFGKGSVQSLIELKGRGTAIKLTTGRYYTPSGRSIHREAWNHLSHDEDTAALDDTTQFDEEGDPAPADSVKRPEFKTRAGRTVYGGGGITPDVVVKADTLEKLSREVERKSAFFDYASRYATHHKGEAAPTSVTPAMWADFQALLAEKKIASTPAELAAQQGYLERGMRRELARRMDGVHGDEDAFKVAIDHDPQLARAVDLLSRAHSSEELFQIAKR